MREDRPSLAARCRLAYLAGVVEAWRRVNGENPPAAVLLRILARYPGDPAAVFAWRHTPGPQRHHVFDGTGESRTSTSTS